MSRYISSRKNWTFIYKMSDSFFVFVFFFNEGKHFIIESEKVYLGWVWSELETQVNNCADKETAVLNASENTTVSNAASSFTFFKYQ